jgi:hypothetical protein
MIALGEFSAHCREEPQRIVMRLHHGGYSVPIPHNAARMERILYASGSSENINVVSS